MNQAKLRLITLGGLLVSGAFTGPAQGAVVSFFTSRSAWETAVGSFTTEDFNSVAPGPLSGSPAPIGVLTFEFPSRAFGDPRIVTAPGPIDGTQALESAVGIDGNEFFGDLPAYNRLILPGFANAWGADFASASSAGQLLLTISGSVIELSTYLPPPGDGFFGIIADTAFDSITITGRSTLVSDPGEIYEMDNVSFNSVPPPVPEPGAYVVLGLGLAVVVVRLQLRARAVISGSKDSPADSVI